MKPTELHIHEELYYYNITKQWYKAKYIILNAKEAKLIKDINISETEAKELIQKHNLHPRTENKFYTFYL